ncbi:MAG TPA: hypothetical protein VMD27_06640 [Candidatus Aquilonibacter sp.]|nr:hypothetical protein [Candidatus Aquilonibacter sp.]
MFTRFVNQAGRLKKLPGLFFILFLPAISPRAFASEINPTNWNENVVITTGLGYKDNVFLTHTPSGGSGFLLTGVNADFFKFSASGWQNFFLINGYDSLYWNNPTIGHEDLWTAAFDTRKKIAPDWTVGALALYAYEGMVVDLASEENVQGAPAKIAGHTLALQPFLRRDFHTNWWLQLEPDVTRQFLAIPGNDFSYTRFGPKFTLGHDYGRRSELSLSYEVYGQRYDSQPETTADGTAIPSTTRWDVRQHVELQSRYYWDAQRRWSSDSKVDFEYSEDNSAGFFNYYRYGCSEELDYQAKTWNARAAADAAQYDYPNPNQADITRVDVTLRAEKNLTKWLKLFGEYKYERSLSSRTIEDYQANTVSGGVEWVF